jgi:TRAP-type C4-dicarboxylate transport system substrate-binding protein
MVRAHQIFYAFASLALACGSAGADPRTVLRFATVAPDGTAWARELRAFSRDLETQTHGGLTAKWYFGGIAGDDVEVGARIQRGQLDGVASGGMLCQNLSPSMRVMRVHGVFQSREEGAFVLSRLGSTLTDEFARSGYTLLTLSGLGPEVVFLRRPIRTFEELRRIKMWRWNLDEIGLLSARELGETVVALPVEEAARAYDERRIDGFFGIPTAALAFQWTARPLYLLDLHTSYLWGCLAMTSRTFARLSAEQQQALRASGAKLARRFEEVGAQQDDALLNGLFARQGVRSLALEPQMQRDFLAAAHDARERLGDKLLPRALLERVLALLADYRAEHRTTSR